MRPLFNTVMRIVSTLLGLVMVAIGSIWMMQGLGVGPALGVAPRLHPRVLRVRHWRVLHEVEARALVVCKQAFCGASSIWPGAASQASETTCNAG